MSAKKRLKSYTLTYELDADKNKDLPLKELIVKAQNIHHATLIAQELMDIYWGRIYFLNENKRSSK